MQPRGIGDSESQDGKRDISAELDEGKEPGMFSEHRKIPLESQPLYQRGTPVDLFNSERWNKSGSDRLFNTGEAMVR
jgi:hypothetical protein